MREGRAGAAPGGARLRPAARRAWRQRCTQGRELVDPFVFAAVLLAAFCHAGWNAGIKRTLDPLATTTLVAVGAGLVALPFVPFYGWPEPASWPWLIASIIIHLF